MGSHEGLSWNPSRLISKIQGAQMASAADRHVRSISLTETSQNELNVSAEHTARRARQALLIGTSIGLVYTALVAIDSMTDGFVRENLSRIAIEQRLP